VFPCLEMGRAWRSPAATRWPTRFRHTETTQPPRSRPMNSSTDGGCHVGNAGPVLGRTCWFQQARRGYPRATLHCCARSCSRVDNRTQPSAKPGACDPIGGQQPVTVPLRHHHDHSRQEPNQSRGTSPLAYVHLAPMSTKQGQAQLVISWMSCGLLFAPSPVYLCTVVNKFRFGGGGVADRHVGASRYALTWPARKGNL
jgi:hypothetical protein